MKESSKIIESELKKYRFREYNPTKFDSKGVDKCWQKCFRDEEDNKQYFLDVKHYVMVHPSTGEDLSGYEIECQLYFKDNHKAFNITFLEGISISEAIEFVDFLFDSGKLDNYENNEWSCLK